MFGGGERQRGQASFVRTTQKYQADLQAKVLGQYDIGAGRKSVYTGTERRYLIAPPRSSPQNNQFKESKSSKPLMNLSIGL